MIEEALMNREELEARLEDELGTAFRGGSGLGVLLLVAEDIRPGDKRRTAELGMRLRDMIRLEDLVGQIDDGTFVVVVRGLAPASMRQLAEWLCARLLARNPATGTRTLASIGLAVANPLDERECAALLLWRAAVALERARAAGGSRVKA